MLEKKGKQKLMKELYIIYKKEGYTILMKRSSSKLKPADLLKVNTTANPISDNTYKR